MKYFITVSLILMMFTACEKRIWIYDYPEPLDIGGGINDSVDVSFLTDIIPVFEKSCTSCHGGGIAPDLRTSKAYNALMNGSKQYVDTTNATASLLYTKIATGGSMATYVTPTEKNLILTWIEQGAKNN